MRRLLPLLLACHAPQYGQLDGRIFVDGAGDASGVQVRAIGPRSAVAVSDSDGNYRLPGLTPGQYALAFDADSTLEGEQVLDVAVALTPSPLPDVHFTAAGSVEGTITLAGAAGAGVVVFVEGAAAAATSDAAGRYHLDRVPAGVQTLEAILSGYQQGLLAGVVVSRSNTSQAAPLDLAADPAPPVPAAALSGTALRIDRDDCSGTLVTATQGSLQLTTTTATDGSYHFDGISTGLYSLRFDYGALSETIPQVLALAGATGQVVDGALYPLATNPLMLPVARRLIHGAALQRILDADRALVSAPSSLDNNAQLLQILSLSDGTTTTLADDSNRYGYLQVAKSLSRVLYVAGAGYSGNALRMVAFDGSPAITLANLTDNYGYIFSLDESRVLYTAQRALFSVPVGGGPAVPLGTVVSSQQLHPDGQRVVFQSCVTSTACSIWIARIDGSSPPLDLSDKQGGFLLAPDGGHLLQIVNYDYDTASGELWLIASDGSSTQMVWSGRFDASPSWSPDGRRATFVTDDGDLRLLDVTAGGTPPIVASKANSATSFSSDGTRLLYQVNRQLNGYFYDLRQQPAAGGAEVALGVRVDSYLLTADGTRTLILDGIDAASRQGTLQVADSAGTLLTLAAGVMPNIQLTNLNAIYQTPDPSRLDLTQLWTAPLAGGAPLLLGPSLSPGLPSPGGAQVSWTGPEQLVQVAPTAGGTPRVVGVGYAGWAGDSRLVLNVTSVMPPYSHQNGLYAFEVSP